MPYPNIGDLEFDRQTKNKMTDTGILLTHSAEDKALNRIKERWSIPACTMLVDAYKCGPVSDAPNANHSITRQ